MPSASLPLSHVPDDTGIRVIQVKPEPKEQIPVVGRNDPCPCGSGKKYKQCHGKNS